MKKGSKVEGVEKKKVFTKGKVTGTTCLYSSPSFSPNFSFSLL